MIVCKGLHRRLRCHGVDLTRVCDPESMHSRIEATSNCGFVSLFWANTGNQTTKAEMGANLLRMVATLFAGLTPAWGKACRNL
jgi:hypothetical protein